MVRSSSFALVVLLGCSALALGAPRIQVHVGPTPVPGSNGILESADPVDFGSADVGTAVSKVFIVRNVGTETVKLGDKVKMPRGFTLMRRFDTSILDPGRTTTFTLALNSAIAGHLGGPLSFDYQGSEAKKATFTVSGSAFGPPSLRIIKNGDPAFRTTGRWLLAAHAGGAGQVTASTGTGTNTATWTFTGLKPGRYQVAVSWSASKNLASDARFTVLNGKVPFTAVPVNQKEAPADFQDASLSWKVLGNAYFITGDTLTVKLTDKANATVAANAVRIARVGFPGHILSPGDRGFGWSGKAPVPPASFSNGYAFTQVPARPGQAIWTFSDLVPGQYRVSVTWNATSTAATNAAYTILDSARALTTVPVNQRQAPHDLHDGGRWWNDLGGLGALHTIRGKSLVVSLNLLGANGSVQAGPVRVERIYNPGGSSGPDGTNVDDAVRFLEQSTWGPNDTEIQRVQSLGFQGYLDDQLAQPTTGYPQLTFPNNTENTTCDPTVLMGEDLSECQRLNYQMYPLQRAFYSNALYGSDQLRQRMAWALHKMWVVSGVNIGIPSRLSSNGAGSYLQILDQNALGNYWDIMFGITLSPAMGAYLNMAGSNKNNPNENYAREILQLFTVGLNQLNPDGTPIVDGQGNPLPTYDQSTIVNYAKSFTGWNLAANLGTNISNYRDPMVATTNNHDSTAKTLLNGYMVPAGYTPYDDLVQALLSIWYHPNLGPFVCKGLIQQLVTSNPDPAYVARVTQWFYDDIGDGTGNQGNLAAVVYAILLDPAARGPYNPDPNFGKLREPAQLMINLLRALNATSYDTTDISDGYLNPQITGMDQDVLRPVTVFSYFMPGWALQNSDPTLNLVGPEFQIFTNVNTFRRINMINTLFAPGSNNYGVAPSNPPSRVAPRGTRPDLSYLKSLTDGDPVNGPYYMADYINTLLLHDTMSDTMYGTLVDAITRVTATNGLKRAQTAVYLIGSSPQYQVQR